MDGLDRKLRKADKYVSGEPLLPGRKLVSGKDNKAMDGPYTEGKEIVGCFFVIKADHYDDGVAIAKDYPDYYYAGSVQVRQVMKMQNGNFIYPSRFNGGIR